MLRVLVFLAVTLWPVAYVHAESVSPWEPGQDLEQIYTQYCSAPNLEKHYFPLLDSRQLAGITRLTSEVLWADLSEDLVGREGASTQVQGRLRYLGRPIAPAFTSMLQQAAKEPMRSKYVYSYNNNADQRSYALDAFSKLGKSDAALGAAMATVLECRIIRNVKSMDPFVASRVDQVSCAVVDGAAAALVGRVSAARRPMLAHLLASAVVGVAPEFMGIGPASAVQLLLQLSGLALGDIGLVEINEAQGAQVLAVAQVLELDGARLNGRGGSIILGHPLAATG